MKLADTGLHKLPFRPHGTPLVIVPYASHKAAIRFLNETRFKDRGLGLLHGPPLSGKTSIVRQFRSLLPDDYAVAVVDANGMEATSFLQEILAQFGYDLGLRLANECFNMIRMVAGQQAASDRAPLLVVENAHASSPVLLEMLCELAELTINGRSALRIILVSDRPMLPIIRAPAMQSVSDRLTGQFLLQPLTQPETRNYVHQKLISGGCREPESVIPPAVCNKLHFSSGGWPGVIDRLALLALARAERCPIGEEHVPAPSGPQPDVTDLDATVPQLIVTCQHRTLQRRKLDGERLTIGRDELCELRVVDDYISRQHAILFRNGKATIVVDLRSRNGTFVNGEKVSRQVLVNNDIVSIGDHRIKFIDHSAKRRTSLQGAGWDDVTIEKSIKDFRRRLAAKLESRDGA